jgi:replicative DNA helicase
LNGGIHSQQLVIIGARPSVGKTTLAQNIILNSSKTGKKCLFVSLEVDKRNVTLKFLSNLCSIPAWKIGRNLVNQAQNQDLNRAKSELRQMAIYTNDSSYLRVAQIGQIIKNQIQKQPVDLVVVDYIQIIKGDDPKGKNEALIIKENTTMLKALAKQYDVGILALAQINRKAVEGANQEPTINDFKSSGGIEEDADVAIILHRDRSEEKKESYFSESGKLIVAKNRHGRTGEIAITFDGNFGRFIELENLF